jgi:hypothetical protein
VTPAQLTLLLAVAELELINAAIAKTDRHGFSASRPELLGLEFLAMITKRDAVCQQVYAAREAVLAERVTRATATTATKTN